MKVAWCLSLHLMHSHGMFIKIVYTHSTRVCPLSEPFRPTWVLPGADRDLARLAAAAQQLPCLERLDLQDVQVGTQSSAPWIFTTLWRFAPP
jgi:hypothetical protein